MFSTTGFNMSETVIRGNKVQYHRRNSSETVIRGKKVQYHRRNSSESVMRGKKVQYHCTYTDISSHILFSLSEFDYIFYLFLAQNSKKQKKQLEIRYLGVRFYCNRVIHDRFWFLILINLVFLDSDLNNNFSFSSEVIKVLHFNIYATSDQGMRSAPGVATFYIIILMQI